MLVVVVYACYARVGSYYKGKVLEGSHAVGKADGDKG